MTVHPYTRLFAGKTTAPTADDDVSLGYEVGDVWIDEVGGVSYQAVDVTDGAAVWQSPAAGSVVSVNGASGVVVLDAGDIGTTPAGGLASTDVQSALNELDTEKAAEASAVMDGDTAGGDLAGSFPNPEVAQASKSFKLTGAVTYSGAGGALNDFNPAGLADASVLIMTVAGIITGIAGGVDGRLLLILAEGAAIALANENVSSDPANRLTLPVSFENLKDKQGALLRYDGGSSRWQLVGGGNSFASLSDVDMTGLADGNGLVWNDDDQIWIPSLRRFIDLSDVPNTFTSHANKLVVVNGAETALEFRSEFNDGEGDPSAVAKTAADGTSGYPARRDHVHTAEGANVTLPIVGTPDFDDVQDMHTIHHSVGIIDGDAAFVTKVDNTHIDVAGGQGLLRTTNDINGDLKFIEWPASSGIVIPAGSSTVDVVRYIGVEYNAGTPQVTVRTTFNWNWQTDFPLARVSQDGTTLRVINTLAHAEDTANWARRFLRVNMPYVREEPPEGTGGLEIGDKATRYLTMSGGNIWHGFNRFVLSALDTSGSDRFDAHYRNAGGGFTHVASQQQWPNTKYDDASGTLADLTANHYGCLWVYVDVSDGTLDVLYGTSNAVSAATAQEEQPPTTIPGHLTAHGRLLGRIIFQKSASAATLVESAWAVSFHAVAGGAVTFNDAEGDPADVTTSAADGTSVYGARRDHAHNLPAATMASVIGAQTEKTTAVSNDKFALLDSAASYALKWMDYGHLQAVLDTYNSGIYAPITGWVPDGDTWTRTGNHTFTVSGDVTARFRKGTKVRYKDGGAYEYGVVLSSAYSTPNTTVTLFTNDDYAMAATTITDKSISYIENPEGFPDWFNWTPTYSASGSMTFTTVTTTQAIFRVAGQQVSFVIFATGTTGGTAATTISATPPATCSAAQQVPVGGSTRDATSGAIVLGKGSVTGTSISIQKSDASNYGLGTGRIMDVSGVYPF